MKRKVDLHRQRMEFTIQRINEINEWRNEAVKFAISKADVERIDARVLELREAVERN